MRQETAETIRWINITAWGSQGERKALKRTIERLQKDC